MKTRWTCPNGCAAVLGPTRPRRDDVCRYCLTCSAKDGRLVSRTAPVLERHRAAREDRRKERTQAEREAVRAKELAAYTVGGRDLREIVAAIYRLPVAREWRERRRLPSTPPKLHVRRTKVGSYRLGVAWPWRHAIQVTVYVGPRPSGEDNIAQKVPLGTLLHEVSHILVSRDRDGNWHGPKFRACLARLTEDYMEAFGDTSPIVEMGDQGEPV